MTCALKACAVAMLSLAVLVGFRPPASAQPACTLAIANAVPLSLTADGSKLLVPVKVDGTKLNMILDTGAESIMLTEDAARRASNTPSIGSLIGGGEDDQVRGFAGGIGGSRVVNALQIQRLDIGRMHGAFQAVAAEMNLDNGGQRLDGLFGMSALGNFDVDLDILGHELRFYSATGQCNEPAAALDQPLYATKLLGGYHDLVREMVAVVINGQTFRAQLDSGSPGTLIYGPAARTLGLSLTASDTGGPIKGSGVGGDIRLMRHVVESIAVGPLTFRNVVVAVDPQSGASADLLLGLDFMTKVHVWFSNSSHMLVMQYPPRPSPALSAADK